MAKDTFSISGMHCASCALIIEKNLKKLPGVKTVNVNFASQQAAVEYDPRLSPPADILAAVKASGYQAQLTKISAEEFDHSQAFGGRKFVKKEIYLF